MGGDKISTKSRNTRRDFRDYVPDPVDARDRIRDLYNETSFSDPLDKMMEPIDPMVKQMIEGYAPGLKKGLTPQEAAIEAIKTMENQPTQKSVDKQVTKMPEKEEKKDQRCKGPLEDPNFREALRWVSEGIYEPPEFNIEWQKGECFAHWSFKPRKNFPPFHFNEEKL